MDTTKTKAIIISLLLLFLISCSGFLLSLRKLHQQPPIVPELIVRNIDADCRIAADPEDRSLTAAAQYLRHAVRRSTGIDLEICGLPSEDEPSASPCILLSVDPEAMSAEGDAYALQLGPKQDVLLTLASDENAFAVVKALCDVWLTTDCGIGEDGSLRLDQEMIDSRLTGLDCALSGTLRILTQNLRVNDDEGGNYRVERAPRFTWLVHDYLPDIIGTQEVTESWIDYLTIGLSYKYDFFGVNREGPVKTGEWDMILYRRDRFKCLVGDGFWLSDTPDVPASMYPGSVYPRTCTWVLLLDIETGQVFYFVNTHLHPSSTEEYDYAQMQLEVLFEEMDKVYARLGEYPVFLVGDFNRQPGTETYHYVLTRLRDARLETLHDDSQINYTYHAYGSKKRLIDYCFFRGDQTVILNTRILDDDYGGYVSDHYGFLTEAYLY